MLFGSVDFVDASETSGFIGLGGGANLAPSSAGGNSVMPYAGTLDLLGAHGLPQAGSGNVKVTVYKNNSATAVTCTIVAPAQLCSDPTGAATYAAGDLITVLVENGTGDFVRYVRWTARYR